MRTTSEIKDLPALSHLPAEIAERIYKDISDEKSSSSVRDFNATFEVLKAETSNNKESLFNVMDISYCFRIAMWTINYLSTEDPSQLHYHAAREVLKKHEDGKLETNEKARDLLARALVKECNLLASQIIPGNALQENIPESQRSMTFRGLLNPNADYLVYPVEGKLWLDHFFIEFVSKKGDSGKEVAREFSEASKKWYSEYQNSKNALDLFRWWVDINKEPYYCRYLKMLAKVLWEDVCLQKWTKESKNVPALTQGVHPSVARILSHRTKAKQIDDRVHLLHEEKIIANLLPTIDPKLIPAITKGIGSLNSLYHHKLIRFECRAGFENWISGKADVRLLKFERGCSEIAEKLELKSKQATDEIKNILHAQAHLNFHFEDGSNGNLIVLSKFRSTSSGREEGIMITLGPQLLPHYTFQTSKRDRLLIPVPDLPPLVSSSNSHASQAALQMLVMQKLSDQSVDLAELGSVEITQEEWNELAKEAGLSNSILEQALDRWINDGDDKPRFLIKSSGNRYSLGQAYQKEEAFLKDQGILRKQRQKSGERSVLSRKKKSD